MATILLTKIKTNLYSVRWKLLLAYLLIIAIAFSVVGFSLLQLVGEYLFNQRVKDDQRIADTLSEQIRDPLMNLDVNSMYELALERCANDEARMLVLDQYGVVQVDTHSALNGMRFANAEASSVLCQNASSSYGFYSASALVTDSIRSASDLLIQNDTMTGVFASAIYVNDEIVGAIVYLSQVQEIYDNLREIQIKIISWLVAVMVAVAFISTFLLKTITRPVGELREGIAKMSRGDFSSRVDVRGKNEFAELGAAFNSMSERLEQLDKSRNQFVSNASHELKTPLSTMKILIETILYQSPIDPDMTKEFLTDVNKEIDRLNRIVSDLLTLVNIDSGGMKLNLTDINLNDLLLEQVKRLAPLSRENGIELECSAKELMEVNGDSVKLTQVIYNVIDNAIKYTPRGGEVHISLTRSGKRAIIRIADTGIGVPAADLPHIFDRFYRVDKARSRATGGTGLGLSIVKQIVLLHGGNITAASEEGKGTTFTIDLPLSAKKEKTEKEA